MAKIGRNDRCPCGSGKKYKQCCLAKDQAAEPAARVEPRTVADAQTADHLPHHHPHFCNDCNAAIDDAANTVIALIDAGKLDEAGRAWSAMPEAISIRPPTTIVKLSALLAAIPLSTIPSSRITTKS